MKNLDVISWNEKAERRFVRSAKALLQKQNVVPVFVLAQEMSYELGCSPETIRRYIVKYTASKAPFEMVGGAVKMRKREKGGERKYEVAKQIEKAEAEILPLGS